MVPPVELSTLPPVPVTPAVSLPPEPEVPPPTPVPPSEAGVVPLHAIVVNAPKNSTDVQLHLHHNLRGNSFD
jgi:hypothetical protein